LKKSPEVETRKTVVKAERHYINSEITHWIRTQGFKTIIQTILPHFLVSDRNIYIFPQRFT